MADIIAHGTARSEMKLNTLIMFQIIEFVIYCSIGMINHSLNMECESRNNPTFFIQDTDYFVTALVLLVICSRHRGLRIKYWNTEYGCAT